MDTTAYFVDPIQVQFQKELRQIRQHILPEPTVEAVQMNIGFLHELKENALQSKDPFMTRYYWEALQDNHYPHHTLRPTYQRARRLMQARYQAIALIAIHYSLLDQICIVKEKNIEGRALHEIPLDEFIAIDTVERPEDYFAKDELLLENFGIKIWKR